MKQTLLLITAITLFIGCAKTEDKTSYVINGKAEGVYNGIRVFLNNVESRGKLKPIDTAIVMNESFQFDGKLENPKLVFVTMNSAAGRFPIMIENAQMELIIDKNNFQNPTFTGSESHGKYLEFVETYQENRRALMTESQALKNAKIANDSVAMELETKKMNELNATALEYPYVFMENNPKAFASLEIFEMQMSLRQKDDRRLIDIFNSFDKTLKASTKGRKLQTSVFKMIADMEANKNLQIGMKAPEFSGPTPEGKSLSLSEVTQKGQVTIVDFWAAWCGPCRRENPNVVRIYNEYHDKGLEIIGVSLDGQARQKDAKKAWIDAIKQDKLAWHQVSNLKYFNDPIAKTYNIQAIPATYILDRDGKIAAKNLRGFELELKVKELLGLD